MIPIINCPKCGGAVLRDIDFQGTPDLKIKTKCPYCSTQFDVHVRCEVAVYINGKKKELSNPKARIL